MKERKRMGGNEKSGGGGGGGGEGQGRVMKEEKGRGDGRRGGKKGGIMGGTYLHVTVGLHVTM